MIAGTAVIYCRKSTDRDDKQQNSLESQITACTRVLEGNNLTLLNTFIESASAKKSGGRPIFEDMLNFCKKGRVQYIIVDEASRLSRNNIDSARILGLLEEGKIKGIFTSSQKYFGEQASELFMLLLNFGMAKLDNDTRARHVKSRMTTCAEKGKCLWRVAFGYKNTIALKDGKPLEKGVSIDPITGPIVKRIYELRGEYKKALPEISAYCKKEYPHVMDTFNFRVQSLNRLLKNPFYMGLIKYNGKIYPGNHEAIISSSLFEKVQELDRGFYRKDKTEGAPQVNFLYKGFIKDSEGIALTAELKENKYIYYRNQNLRSGCKVNISQKRIDEKVIERLKLYKLTPEIYELCLILGKQIINKQQEHIQEIENELKREIDNLKTKGERLVHGYMEGIFDEVDYKKMRNEMSEKISLLLAKKSELKITSLEDFHMRMKEMFELVDSLSERYKQGNDELRLEILKKCEFELFVDTKKELTIKENKLFSDIIFISFRTSKPDGSATENRTPVYGMKTRCPNH